MSLKSLQAELRQFGIKPRGRKDALLRAHREYCIRFNAECDALAPRPVAEIAAEVQQLLNTIAAPPAPPSPEATRAAARSLRRALKQRRTAHPAPAD